MPAAGWVDALGWLAACAAAIAAAGVVWRFVRFCVKVVDLVNTLLHESKSNDGGSMKDQLTRVDERMERVETEVNHARLRHHDLISDFSVVKGELELHIDRHPPAYPRRPPGL